MPNMNRVQIMGHLGRDPEIRQAGGGAVANFSVATTERWKGKDGEQQERTEWVRCSGWGWVAEAAERLHKGDAVYVEGNLQTREYTDKDGNKQRSTEVNVRVLEAIVRRERSGGGERRPEPAPPAPQTRRTPDIDDLPF